MPTNPSEPDAQEASYGGAIVLFGVIALGLTWTYLLYGTSGLGWWAVGAPPIVIIPTMYLAWRWRRQRTNKQLEALQRWADEDDAKKEKRRRKRA